MCYAYTMHMYTVLLSKKCAAGVKRRTPLHDSCTLLLDSKQTDHCSVASLQMYKIIVYSYLRLLSSYIEYNAMCSFFYFFKYSWMCSSVQHQLVLTCTTSKYDEDFSRKRLIYTRHISIKRYLSIVVLVINDVVFTIYHFRDFY